MKPTDQEWRWILGRLSGNIAPEDDHSLTTWLNSADENRYVFSEAEKIWNNSGLRLTLNNLSTDDEWEKLKLKIHTPERGPFPFAKYAWLAMAASLIFFIVFGKYLFNRSKPLQQPDEMVRIVSSNEVTSFYLPDSSHVWLNTNSQLTYSKASFGKTNRQLHLIGEGYFDIKRRADLPLSIGIRNTLVTVLGTSFNIQEKDSSVIVIVVHGKVDVRNVDIKKNVLLTDGEKSISTAHEINELDNKDTSFSALRKRNNPSYEDERNNPRRYLIESHSWKKNAFNQTVIEGVIKNAASLAVYHKITVKVSYHKLNGKIAITRFTIDGNIGPGQSTTFRKKLLDIFTTNQHIEKVELEGIETREN